MFPLKIITMRKILLLPVLIMLLFNVQGQNKNWQNVSILHSSEKINPVQKSTTQFSAIAWSNDFSQSTDWSFTNQTNDNQNFIITASAPQGTYSAPLGILNSFSPQNGFALFDSDYLGTSGGTQNACICIQNPADLSNYHSTLIRFYQKFRKYQNESTFVGISTDGSTWTEFEVNASLTAGTLVDNMVVIDISQIADNQSTVYVRFHYTGSWEYAWEIDDVSIEGVLFNPPQIVSVSPTSGTQGDNLAVSLSGQYTHFNQGSETVWFEQATSTLGTNTPGTGQTTVFYGSNVFVNSAISMNFDLNIPVTTMAGLYDAKVQNPTDGIVVKADAFEVHPITPPSNWVYNNTGINHSILIPDVATITVDGSPLPLGSYIGVFYDSAGTLACGGYLQWLGETDALTAWGDDPGTTYADGFQAGEQFTWMLFDYTTGTVSTATATYQSVGFPNSGNFVANGISGISALTATTIDIQTLNLPSGWSIFSTYINPTNPDIETVFAPILSNLVIIKDGNGNVYWPPFVNLIGNMTIGEGYQINVSTASSIDISGQAVTPETTPITIPSGWSIIGYLRQSPANIVGLMSPILSELVIVKDGVGSVYWPVWGVNGIGNMDPGEGYQIRVNNQVTLTYPANAASAKQAMISVYEPVHYNTVKPGSSNMTLLLPADELKKHLVFGDEIAVCNANGTILGSAVFTGTNTCITLWGSDDVLQNEPGFNEGEPYKVMAWKTQDLVEIALTIDHYLSGSDRYKKNELAVATSIQASSALQISEPYPNPAKTYFTLRVQGQQNEEVSFKLYASNGELVLTKTQTLDSGSSQQIRFDLVHLPAGTYFLKINGSNNTQTKKLNIIR